MKSAQVGATEIINNVIGYYIDQDPSPILLILPTKEIGEAWSKDRFAPMLRDSPCLRSKVSDVKSRDKNNTLLHKKFPGGHITIGGANSPAGLASRPIRIVLFDEVDRFPESAGSEGDPISLGKKRATTFWNRKFIDVSCPTIDEISRIQKSFKRSDQRYYYVPCPHCSEFHRLEWKHVHWGKGEDGEHFPETAAHFCPHCGGMETDADLPVMLANGEWRKHHPEVKGHAGFHINELYSPWVKFSETVKNFLKAENDQEQLKVWVNTALGEVWKEGKDIGDAKSLMKRRENYDAELVPEGVKILTAAVDVQDNRLEVETIGWGKGYESWSIEYKILAGDTSRSEVWQALDLYLHKVFDHELGYRLRIKGCGIDTGGHRTKEVYAFCKPRLKQRVFALKGDGGNGKPLVSRPSRNNLGKVLLFRVGVDSAKNSIMGYIKQENEGPGYCHFPHNYDRAYFKQLLSERPVISKGKRVWKLKREGARNEALDLRVYNLAVLEILGIDMKVLDRMSGPFVFGTRQARGRRVLSRGVA